MAILDMSAADEALKLFYLDGINYQLNTAMPILSVMERDTESVQGSHIVMALRYGRQGGVGNGTDVAALPTPNSRKTKQARWETKNMYAQINISDKTIKASKSRDGAFLQLLEADLDDAMQDAKNQMSRQVFGDGTGALTTFTGASATATQVVANAMYFNEGMYIDIYNSALGTQKYSGVEIMAVDEDTKTLTLGTSVTTVAGDVAVMKGNLNQELTGLGSVFTPNNTLYGINRAQNPWFNPTTISIAGNITELKIQEGLDNTERTAGGNVNFFSASYGVRRAYQNLLQATKSTVEVMKLKGGYDVLSYNGKPFSVDKYNPANTLYGMDMTTWRLYHMGDFEWLSQGGSILRLKSGFPVWEAALARYADMGCNKPKANVKFTGIVEM